jgi:molecular chaperone DnaK
MGRVLGIDLGTTNSAVAVMDRGTPLVVPVDQGRFVMPSVVAFAADGKHLIGRAAKRQSMVNPKGTIIAAKRLMGLAFSDERAKQAMSAATYQCVAGPQNDIRVQVGPSTYAIPEVSALILGELKRCAEAHFNEPITQAVVTVPAYFNDFQRQATRDAARIAGLDILRILNEPTAAALAYGALQGGADRRVVVYDLGGGTFDVSVLEMKKDVVEVRATAGDAFLGGRDFDQRIVEYLVDDVRRNFGFEVASDLNALQRVWEAAETAKIDLSEKPKTKVALPFLTQKPDGTPIHLDCLIERETYEGLVVDLVERTITTFVETIRSAGMEPRQLDEVILVGGMTRMPMVQKRVTEFLGKTPSSGVHPDLVVAVGAAIQGALLQEAAPKTRLLDVTPHNLGIVSLAGLAETIIPKDTAIPAQANRVFTTVRDQQDAVRITVFQGDSRHVQNNQVLGEFLLDGLRKAARGVVQIEVTFAISVDGIVSVSAKDIETGKAQAIQIEHSHTLPEAELQSMTDRHRTHVPDLPSAAR